MKSNSMSDEELDGLFRKSAEGLNPPFEEEAWQAMEQQLDRVPGHRTWLRRLLPFLFLGLIPLLLVFNLTSDHPDTIAAGGEAAATKGASASPGVPLAASVAPQSGGGQHALVQKASKYGMSVVQPTHKAPAAAAPASPLAREAGEALQTNSVRTTEPQTIKQTPTQQLQQERTAAPVPALVRDESAATETDTALASAAGILAVADSEEAAAPAADSSSKKQPFVKNLQVTLVVAPDITSIKFKTADAVSANAGLLLGLPLSRRFSLITGAVWANKVYDASPEDYVPSPDFWKGKKLPSNIKARCEVLDIPLNLEYKLWMHNQNQLTVQAGLSSYIMLHEKYTYTYGSGYGGSYDKVWEVRNQNKHWFKVQNVSVSYARQITPALAIGAAPFVKVPLAGIGAGHVRLSSAGVFFTASYRPHTP